MSSETLRQQSDDVDQETPDEIHPKPVAVPRSFSCLSLREKLKLAAGKIRRFYQGHLRRGYVRAQQEIRQGECERCGVCCQLLFRCPFLGEETPGVFACSIHGKKPENCYIFPISSDDLKDRNVICPSTPCGYKFPRK